jgi:hypothetical protein
MPDPIPRKDVTNRAMVAGNEKHISIIIESGIVKEWVGIGWIDLRPATKTDRKTFPEVNE